MSAATRATRATRRLIDTFGAERVLALDRPLTPMTTRERVAARLDVEARVEACRACPLSDRCREIDSHFIPLTPVWSPARLGSAGRVAVVGEAPNVREHAAGGYGHGRPQSILWDALRRGGLPEQMVTYLAAVACTPLTDTATPPITLDDTRPPQMAEVNACRTNVLAALHAADVDYVLLLGAAATKVWRPDLQVTKLAGGLYVWNRRWLVWPMPHTNSMLRGTGPDAKEWQSLIAGFCQIVADQVGMEGLGSTCVECGDAMYGWDGDGVPWCDKHFDKGERGGRRPKKQTDTNQGRLL